MRASGGGGQAGVIGTRNAKTVSEAFQSLQLDDVRLGVTRIIKPLTNVTLVHSPPIYLYSPPISRLYFRLGIAYPFDFAIEPSLRTLLLKVDKSAL
jgi:hypothetical protein